MDRGLRDFFNIIILLALAVIRIFVKDSQWMDLIAIIALGVALADLYTDIAKRYSGYEKFVRIRGFAMVFGAVYIVIICFVAIRRVDIPGKWVDVLSLTALLVSVPSDLYCSCIGKYLASCGKHRERSPGIGHNREENRREDIGELQRKEM